MQAKKRLGQNFLIDNNIINKIANEVIATEKDLIIEIGPGQGALTKELIKKKSNIICYEIDTDLDIYLEKLKSDKVHIVYEDILKTNIQHDIKDISYNNLYIVGNLPYYITTPIIEHIIESKLSFNKFTIMVQKEVADRFVAKPKNKEYGYMTLVIDYYFDAKRVCNVSKNSFKPAPKVESAVVSFIPKNRNELIDEGKYFSFLKECFSQKRKTLRNNLKKYNWLMISEILNNNGYSESTRSEELPQKLFIEIYKKLFE